MDQQDVPLELGPLLHVTGTRASRRNGMEFLRKSEACDIHFDPFITVQRLFLYILIGGIQVNISCMVVEDESLRKACVINLSDTHASQPGVYWTME